METELGYTYQDKITGFIGVATGKVQYITGCNQTLLAPTARDGALVDSQWFDDQRLQSVPADQIVLENSTAPGPDRQAPKR